MVSKVVAVGPFFFIFLYCCHTYGAYFSIAQLYTLTIERQFFKNLSPVEIIINVTFTAVISNSASPSHWKESYVLKIPFLKIIFDLSLLHDSRFKKNTFLILLRHFVKVQLFNCPMIWHIFLFMIINKIVICF